MKRINKFLICLSFIIAGTTSLTLNKVTSKNKEKQAPFESSTAIQLVRDLSKLVLLYPTDPKQANDFASAVGTCFKEFDQNPDKYTAPLKAFWDAAQKANTVGATGWTNDIFDKNVVQSLSQVVTKLNQNELPCSLALKMNPATASKDVWAITNTPTYFAGFNNTDPSKKQKMITSMFSVHRNLLPGDSFKNLNTVSRTAR